MSLLIDYVRAHTDRGECGCGECLDRGAHPDPTGHVADLVFFKVGVVGTPDAADFLALTAAHKGEFGDCDPLDGREHNYLELGGWIGDQSLAMRYMGLGALLGLFRLLSPDTLLPGLGLDEASRIDLAKAGLLAVMAAKVTAS